jgi:PAS domain S-box-containing protein
MSEPFPSKRNLNLAQAASLNSEMEIECTPLTETLIEIAFDAVFILNPNGVVTKVNARACELLGYSRNQLLDKAVTDLISPDEVHLLSVSQTSLGQNSASRQIWNYLHKDGSRIPTEVSAKILPDGCWVTVVRDLRDRLESDHNQVPASLQWSEEQLKLALQGAGQGIWSWDLKTQILNWDERCKEIFGLPPNFPVTYEWHLNALHPEDRQRVSDAAAIALHNHTEFDEEYRTFQPDGTVRWVLARGRGL